MFQQLLGRGFQVGDSNSDACMAYWWDDRICLKLPTSETMVGYFKDGESRNGLRLTELTEIYGKPGNTRVDGLDIKQMTRWLKNHIETNAGFVKQGNIVYNMLCQGDRWFADKPCETFKHLKPLIQNYKFSKESHVYVWPNHIALELSNGLYYHFQPARHGKLKFQDVPIAPQCIGHSLEETVEVLGEYRRINVGFLNEQKVLDEVQRLEHSALPYQIATRNCITFVAGALCNGSDWYKDNLNAHYDTSTCTCTKINDVLKLVNERRACTLYLWSRQWLHRLPLPGQCLRLHISLQLPNGEYISHYPEGNKKTAVKNAIRGTTANMYISYEEEARLKKEHNQYAEEFKMTHLNFDITKMTNYWYKYLDEKHKWNAHEDSCCSVVYKVMCAGSELFRGKFNERLTTPQDVMQLAKDLDAENSPKHRQLYTVIKALIGFYLFNSLSIFLCYLCWDL